MLIKSPERVRLTGGRACLREPTPIGQFVLIGNFRRRLARELLVILSLFLASCKVTALLPKPLLSTYISEKLFCLDDIYLK